MVEYSYSRSYAGGKWDLHNPDKVDATGKQIFLDKDVEAALPGKTFKTKMSGSVCVICFDEALTSGEEVILDQAVEDHRNYVGNLDYIKTTKNLDIDGNTEILIYEGFTFDGETFSLSDHAQTNWIAIKTLEALLSFPMNVTTLGNGEYSLAQANVNAFVGAAAATKQAHLDSGRALKIQVNAATTEAEVYAVVDNR